MNVAEKQEVVSSLTDRFASSGASFFLTYQGSTCVSMVKLRNSLRESGSSFRVIKNTLAKRSLTEEQVGSLDGVFAGPTAVVFAGEDPAAAAKAISEFSKDNEFVSVKAGLLEGDVIDESQFEALSKLPSREELIAKLLQLMNAPATKLLQTINAPGTEMVRLLSAVKDTKE